MPDSSHSLGSMGWWFDRVSNGLGRAVGVALLVAASIAALSTVPPPASAQGESLPAKILQAQPSEVRPAAGACRFDPAETGQVAGILDGRSFTLHGGRTVRLAAIETPFASDAGDARQVATARAAQAALASLLLDRTVTLHHAAAAPPDRYGRTIAHVTVGDATGHRGDGASAAHALVAAGHARVAARVESRACAAELLRHERMARAAKLGLWADPYYSLMVAGDGGDLLAARGRFAIVEGQVVSVRESGGTIYVNFGRRWSQALTVTISKRHEGIFAAAGMPPKGLENRRVRVRGWIDERNGPRIEADRAEQIEIAERD